ncbi:hypothetical protein P154DRAFT_447336 [Amniculicola lignicola CBS 123094]|uniref:Zn(2)-C6 fungal-type domain-containing protein n=1 Tax=Amniculicola lignicola CBS 123094 TaxID=1392246 RepID=A0A6A5VYT2_9PLEO|nr:hypothetical protein P154DRAFT_447336 [Amniculicola lignicola CBS 123094]
MALEYVEKASTACAYCRARKQSCDKCLPRCSRCASKFRHCDYTPFRSVPTYPIRGAQAILSLLVERTSCGPNLSAHGATELLRTASEGKMAKLGRLCSDVLIQADVAEEDMVHEYKHSMHPWLPAISVDFLGTVPQLAQRSCQVESPRFHTPGSGTLPPLLALGLFLLTRRPCAHAEHIKNSTLYVTVKQILTTLSLSEELLLDVLQASLLVAAYECGHGMARQAYLTIGSCASILNLLDSTSRQNKRGFDGLEFRRTLWTATLFMDRVNTLSTLAFDTPLACPTSSPLSRRVERSFSSVDVPTLECSPEEILQLHITAKVTLITGRVLEYVFALKEGSTPQEDYASIEEAVSNMAIDLVVHQANLSWPLCDAIALVLCSALVLHTTQVTHDTLQTLPKARLALKSSQDMARDMVHSTMAVMQPQEIRSHSFAGLCCVLGLAPLLTGGMVDGGERAGDLRRVVPIVKKFAARWNVGKVYLEALARQTERSSDVRMEWGSQTGASGNSNGKVWISS